MNRREALASMGALTGSSLFALGTGAFSAAEIERNANISIVDDSDGLVGLVPNEEIAGVRTNSGQLTIGLGGDDPGVNVDSVYQFGKFKGDDDVADLTDSRFTLVTDDDPADVSDGQDSLESAFAVVNQSTQKLDVTIEFDLDDDLDGDSGTEYAFELQTSIDGDGERIGKTRSPIEGDEEAQLAAGDSFGVSFIVNAFGGTTDDEISGSLSISAESV